MLFLFLGFINLNFEEWTRLTGQGVKNGQDCRIYWIDYFKLNRALRALSSILKQTLEIYAENN
jgi:hypothetical protein